MLRDLTGHEAPEGCQPEWGEHRQRLRGTLEILGTDKTNHSISWVTPFSSWWCIWSCMLLFVCGALHLSIAGRSSHGEGAAFRPETLPMPQTQRHQITGVYTKHIAVQRFSHPSGLGRNQPVPLYIFKIDNSCHKKAPSSWPGFNKTQVTGAFSLLPKGEIKVVLVPCGAGKDMDQSILSTKSKHLRLGYGHERFSTSCRSQL